MPLIAAGLLALSQCSPAVTGLPAIWQPGQAAPQVQACYAVSCVTASLLCCADPVLAGALQALREPLLLTTPLTQMLCPYAVRHALIHNKGRVCCSVALQAKAAGFCWSQAAPFLADLMPQRHQITFGAHLGFHVIGQPTARCPCGCTVAEWSAADEKESEKLTRRRRGPG